MAEMKEVPTEELLSFQDYPTTHTSGNNVDPFAGAQININVSPEKSSKGFDNFNDDVGKVGGEDEPGKPAPKSFWSMEYFQQYFDVETTDVTNRILGSMIPSRDNAIRREVKARPDLYGPFWISITLVFAIAISGNIANYLQHHNDKFHWKYDFHLVSYAATTIFLYISVVPLGLWGLLKWSAKDTGLEDYQDPTPKALELICVYGYSLFIYIPTSVLWTIQVYWLQWLLVILAGLVSGAVLLLTLSTSLSTSRHKILISAGIIGLHLLLAAGFMMFFFHDPHAANSAPIPIQPIVTNDTSNNKTKT